MDNEHISKPYYDSLQNLQSFPFFKLPFTTKAPYHDRDRRFANVILRLRDSESAQKKYPHLLEHVKNHPHFANEIYNESTCLEFHLLLSKFKGSLDQLKNIKTRELPSILKALNKVFIYGDYLSAIVRSSVAETHLQTIAGLLFVDPRKYWMPEIEDDTNFADFQYLKPCSV